jgi:hypothetical protein
MSKNETEVHYILQDRLPALEAKINKINDKLKAAGIPQLVIDVSGPEVKKIDTASTGDYMSVYTVSVSREVMAPVGRVELLAETKIDPVTEWMEHTTFTKLTPAEHKKVTEPVSACFCDHCEKNQLRIYIYTVKSPLGISRVGSGCLDNYTGFSPGKMGKWQEAYKKAVSAVEEVEAITFTDVEQHAILPVDLFLMEAVEQIQGRGYQGGYNGQFHTGSETFSALRAKLQDTENPTPSYSPTTAKKAKDVQEFLVGTQLDPAKRVDDYYRNLRSLLEFGHLTWRQAGLLASSIVSFDKEISQAKERAKAAGMANAYIGVVGEKLILKNLRVESAYADSGQWGATTDFQFYDEEGHLFRWNASGSFDIKRGETVHIEGKLTKHREWTSHKLGKQMLENTLTRCKFHTLEEIEELIANPPKAKKPRKAQVLNDTPTP